jgi:hypothetical protein
MQILPVQEMAKLRIMCDVLPNYKLKFYSLYSSCVTECTSQRHGKTVHLHNLNSDRCLTMNESDLLLIQDYRVCKPASLS